MHYGGTLRVVFAGIGILSMTVSRGELRGSKAGSSAYSLKDFFKPCQPDPLVQLLRVWSSSHVKLASCSTPPGKGLCERQNQVLRADVAWYEWIEPTMHRKQVEPSPVRIPLGHEYVGLSVHRVEYRFSPARHNNHAARATYYCTPLYPIPLSVAIPVDMTQCCNDKKIRTLC